MDASKLSIGAFGQGVAAVQTALQSLGYDIGASELQRSFFGPVTRRAVQQFQKENGLAVSGKVDPQTAAALGAAGSAARTAAAPSIAATGPAPPVSTGRGGTQTPRKNALSGEIVKPISSVSIGNPASFEIVTHLPAASLGKPVLATLADATIDAGAKSALTEILNGALKSQMVNASIGAGYSELASLIQASPAIDVVADRNLTLQEFVTRVITLPADATGKAAVEAAIAKISTTTTVADLLGLNSSISANPLLSSVVKQTGLASLLRTSATLTSSTQLIDDFISQYAVFQGSMSNFWSLLSQNTEFKAVVPELQLTLQLGTLTLDNPQLVSALRTQYPQMTSPRSLTPLSAADWEKLIAGQNITVPAAITGATAAAKASNYAAAIVNTLKQAFPGAYFAQDLQAVVSASKNPVDQGISTFIKNAPDFDILNTNINAFYAQKGPSALQGIDSSVQPAVTAALAAWQRVARITPDYPTANSLQTAGFSSAFQVASTPRTSFVQQFAGLLGASSAAEAVYARAQHIGAQSAAIVSNIRILMATAPTRAIGNVGVQVGTLLNSSIESSTGTGNTAPAGIATWQTLFGPLSSCCCTDCRSLYSAAAYFVDLLQFLKKSNPNSNGYTPFDSLVARRPDLPYIKLNCANTNTELPYVDLVNETLEYFVANQGKLDSSAAHNTPKDATTDELSVSPEYTDDDAYNASLNTAVFPPSLPYDRWLYTARTYLNFMGSGLYDVMSSCQTGGNAADFTQGTPSGIALACEYLNISEAECAILTGEDFSGTAPATPPPLYAFFGYAGLVADDGVKWELDVAGFPSPTNTPPGIGVENLLNRMAIAYTDLVALLGTRALNPNLTLLLQAPAAAPCDLTQTTLIDISTADGSLPDTTLSLMHRFIRLWKKIGGAIGDLDKTMTGLAATDINQQFLVSLAALKQIQAALNQPLLQALSFWSGLDTDGRDSLYLTLFQNKTVLNPPDSAFQLNYVAPLAAPPTVQFPSPPFPNLTYFQIPLPPGSNPPALGFLTANRAIGSTEYAQLQAVVAATDSGYQQAIGTLYGPPAETLASLPSLPAAQLPPGLAYDAGAKQLTFTGQMTDDTRALLNFSNDVSYQTAVDAIYGMRTLWGATLLGSASAPGITNHTNTILAALGISAQDLAQIRAFLDLADPALPQPPTPLTLANVSAICRYVFLAQGLGLSVSDLITVIQLTGVDPLDNQNPAGTLRFVTAVQGIQASPFSIAQLNYLYRHVYDPNAGIAPLPANISLFLGNLQMGLSAIVSADVVVPDPQGALLLKSLSTLLGASTATAAMGLITATGVYSASLPALLGVVLPGFVTYDIISQQLSISGAMSAAQQTSLLSLSPDPVYQQSVNNLFTASQAAGAATYSEPLPALLSIGFTSLPAGIITYDNAAQQLRFTGGMSMADQAALLTLSSNPLYAAAIQNLRQQQTDFISASLTFLNVGDAVTQLIDNPANLTVADKVAYVTAQLMPYLQQIQSKTLVTQTLCTNLGLNSQLGGLLLNTILKSQVSPGSPATAMSDFLALVGDGLTAAYYPTVDLSGPPAMTRIDAIVDFNWGFGFPTPSTGAPPFLTSRPFSAKWTGYVMPQYSEAYTFYVQAGDGVRLSVNGTQIINRWSDQMPAETSGQLPNVSFAVGQMYAIELDYYDRTAAGIVELSWSSPSTPQVVIPQTQLFSGSVITSLSPIVNSYTLLYKINLLVGNFALTPLDVAYFWQHGQDFAGQDPNNPSNPADSIPFDPNQLPLSAAAFKPAMFSQWQRLNSVVNLRNAIPGGDAALLNVFYTASTGYLATQSAGQPPTPLTSAGDPLAMAITQAAGWNAADLIALTGTGFGLTYADFVNEKGTAGIGLLQLQACMALVGRLGISAAQLFAWAQFVSTPLNETATAADIQNTVKSKYSDATWDTVGKPLNDAIRQSSKDALIAYILANAATWNLRAPDDGTPITTADQLYEFFLIDVEMSTCMLTSRIVQANAAVQLFVQRCLMNLEAADPVMSVSPAAIDTTYWGWMQNFRVWQANRQVFLYPENWMVPTLRDDKTPFFQDLENALLQNPITTDTVEQAYLDYLSALDGVARLDIRGMYWQLDPNSTAAPDGTPDATNDVLHVFGRTNTQPYSYYYRRLLNATQFELSWPGGAWTPWELVGVDIQADHLVPVVWDGRLYLFWPTFTQSADPSTQGPMSVPSASETYTPAAPAMDLSIALNWSQYKQGAWSPKMTSDPIVFQNLTDTIPSYILTLGGSTLDTSNFKFNAAFPGGDALAIEIYLNQGGEYILGQMGQFTFSSCGGTPLGQPFPSLNYNRQGLIPVNTIDHFNSVERIPYSSVGDPGLYPNLNTLTVQVGIVPPSFGPGGILEYEYNHTIELLEFTPTDSPYDLLFPQQFYASYGLMAPSPFSGTQYLQWNENIYAPSSGALLVSLGEPFFYRDSQRVYFVTDTFTVGSLAVSDASQESGYYSRSQLIAPAQVANNAAIFGPADKIGKSSPSPPPNTSQTPQPAAGNAGTANQPPSLDQVLFSTFFHPHVCSFIKAVNQYGIQGLLTLPNQALNNDNGVVLGFTASFDPINVTVSLSPGVLIAQGHIYEAVAPTTLALSNNDLSQNTYLYFNYSRIVNGKTVVKELFYFSQNSHPENAGDAFVWSLTAPKTDYGLSGFSQGSTTAFEQTYGPNISYIDPVTFPRENVDFSVAGAYSIYNWELFFHIPLLIATQLSANQQFSDSQKWFHYIFNPLSSSPDPVPNRYWNFLPFYECAPWDNLAGQWEILLGLGPSLCGVSFTSQISSWKSDPFNPFVIGRMRTIAFRMNVVMAYLDNLIAWGDNLFGQNTRESINEATQIYVLAKEILGPRPIQIPQRGESQDYSYNDLATLFGIDDDLSNATVLIENDLPYVTGYGVPADPGLGAAISMATPAPYFCLPPNDNLLAYWSTVEDRLYKIRHCMNIQGVVEQLPLFSPPISPALLVAAAAAGVDLSSVLSNTNAGTSFYRFKIMIQKALELCAEVKSLGAAMLSALEKQDAEALALLRATQESNVLQAMQKTKEFAVQEAQANLAALQASLQTAKDRQSYYSNLHTTGLAPEETGQQTALKSAANYQQQSIQNYQSACSDVWIPEFSLGMSGFGGSPTATIAAGGSQMAASDNSNAAMAQSNAAIQSNQSSQLALQGQWNRRDAEWVFQAAQATDEMAQINAQIGAATLRVQIAQEDQSNLALQIQNAQQVSDFLTGKYTNTQLYSWMAGQISTIFFQCYQMAYDLASRAEAGFRFERGMTTSNYIQFGYWDSLKKGLLSGERLYSDLKRLEIAYLETDVREFEITKSISLVLFNPLALIALKETGSCTLNLPEAFFDMDYPGQYFRRIKTVSLTIPCVTGPYTSVNCTLTLQNSKVRVDNAAISAVDYANDSHFITNYAATQSMATSTASNDSGMFELNFRDERYLPFEGAGLISTWLIEMPLDCNAFDFETITDVVINVRYTSRYGGDNLRDLARKVAVLPPAPAQSPIGSGVSFPAKQSNLLRYFSLRHEFPTEWYKLLQSIAAATGTPPTASMQINLSKDRFPFQYRGKIIGITQAQLVVVFYGPNANWPNAMSLALSVPPPGPPPAAPPASFLTANADSNLGSALSLSIPLSTPQSVSASQGAPNLWTLWYAGNTTNSSPPPIADIFLVCEYSVSGKS